MVKTIIEKEILIEYQRPKNLTAQISVTHKFADKRIVIKQNEKF